MFGGEVIQYLWGRGEQREKEGRGVFWGGGGGCTMGRKRCIIEDNTTAEQWILIA